MSWAIWKPATFACAALTSWSALTQYDRLQPGDWLQTHGTGGVSIAALQLAKAMGANVAITSSSDAKLNRARALGADVTVNYRDTPDWEAAIRAALGGNKVANVIDTVGEVQFDRNVSLLREGGQLFSHRDARLGLFLDSAGRWREAGADCGG